MPSQNLDDWEQQIVAPLLKKQPERKKSFPTLSGIDLPRLALPQDIDQTYRNQLGFPGEYPFTRGVQATMYRGRFWTMRQYAGFGTAEETNQRYHYLLAQGQTGLSVAFDLPTQMGYDSDHTLAQGEVGKVGVAIASLKDMQALLKNIPLDKISISMTINATASILLAMVICVAKQQGMDPRKLRGTVQNDILKEYIARGTYIYPPRPSMRLITDMFEYCSQELPLWNPISISGYHIREAGSTAVQEVAFTLANGLAYVKAAMQKGLKIIDFAPRLSFFFNVHNHFLEEIAKFRAARRLWARLLSENFGVTDPESLRLRFHTQTAGSSLTRQEPENNVVRVALQAMAAVLGGTQSLHTNSRDEALGLPTQQAAHIALRTQQIIAHETGVGDSIDPLGGSYLIEQLTDQIERESRAMITKVDELGGVVAAIESGYIQRELEKAAYETQKAIENEELLIVGVNAFTEGHESSSIETMKIDPSLEKIQVEGLQAFRQARSQEKTKQSLDLLTKAAQGTENLMPLIIAAIEAGATLGEISDRFRGVFGLYQDAGGM